MKTTWQFVGEKPFCGKVWRMFRDGKPTNWYAGKFGPFGAAAHPSVKNTPYFCVYAWRGGDYWNIPAGMLGVSAKQAFEFLRK